MRIGFIGLEMSVPSFAVSLIRRGHDLVARDLERTAAAPLLDRDACWVESPAEMAAFPFASRPAIPSCTRRRAS